MKLSFVNKIYVAIALTLVAAIAYKVIRYQPGSRYYYAAGAGAPASFPVYVREMYFITANPNEDVYISTETVNNHTGGWGNDYFFAEASYANLLPEKLVLKYASFRESNFYNDTILLPVAAIRTAYKEAMKNNAGKDIYYRGQQKQGMVFLVGIANNGNIILWLKGSAGRKEIFRTKIYPRQPQESDTYYGEPMSPQQYLTNRFSALGDSMQTLFKSGYDAKANYIDSVVHDY
ncbi:MAG: DUF2931 family protein [Ferruginibacter sp.]